jgi:hypothetical protein
MVSFTDQGGVTADGSRIARVPLSGKRRLQGYVEERPGRVSIAIECVALSYPAVQQLCAVAAPAGLAALASPTPLWLGSTADERCVLEFCDFSACLHSLVFSIEPDRDRPFCRGSIEFHLDGFLRTQLRRTALRGAPATKPDARRKR